MIKIAETLYLTATIFAFGSVITKCIELNKNIREQKCIDIADVFTNLFLSIMFFLKIPYLWNKIIARISLFITASCWLIISIIQYHFIK